MPALLATLDPTRRWHLRRAAVLAVMVLAAALGAAALPGGCLAQLLLDLPCPGCGLTRSVAATAHGDWSAAWILHPLGPPVALAFGLLFLGSLRLALRPARSAAHHQRALVWIRRTDRLLILSLTAVWLWRLTAEL